MFFKNLLPAVMAGGLKTEAALHAAKMQYFRAMEKWLAKDAIWGILQPERKNGRNMKIDITKNEYRRLLDILSIADWVMNAFKTEDDPGMKPYADLTQKLLACAEDFGFGNLVAYDKKCEKYFPTLEYEDAEPGRTLIDEFEEEVFWEELCHRLAERDLIEERGIDEFEKMAPEKRMAAEDQLIAEYDEEFVRSGIKNLRLLKQRDNHTLH